MKSFTPAETARLIALEAKMDQVLFGQHFDAKTGKMVDDSSILPTVATVGATGAAAYGGYKGVQAVGDKIDTFSKSKKLGGMGRDFTKMGKLGQIGTAGKAVGTDILDYIKNVGSKLTNMKKLAAITEAIELEVK